MNALARRSALVLFIFFVSFSCVACAQNTASYLNDTGGTAYGINVPVENGFINLSNGNLHLEFPLSRHPQRGALSLEEKLTYDSRIWNFSPYAGNGSYHWWPYNVFGASTTSGGWQFVTGGEVGLAFGIVTGQQMVNCDTGEVETNDNPTGTYTPTGPRTRYSYTID